MRAVRGGLTVLLLLWAFDGAARGEPEIRRELAEPALRTLETGWQYRWGESAPGDRGVSAWARRVDDSAWRPLHTLAQPPGRGGRDNLWLRVRLPGLPWRDPALYMGSVFLNVEAYLDGRLLYRSGRINGHGRGFIRELSGHVVPLPAEAGGKWLYLRLFSDYTLIGLYGPVRIGPQARHLERLLLDSADELALGLLSIGLGLYALLVLIFHPGMREVVFFSLFAVASGWFGVRHAPVASVLVPDPLLWHVTGLLCTVLMPVGMLGFVTQVFGPGWRGSLRALLWAFGVLATLAVVVHALAMLAPGAMPAYYGIMSAVKVLAVLALGVTVGHALRRAWRREADALLLVVGLAALGVTVSHDVGNSVGMGAWSGITLHWGGFVFLLMLGTIIVRRHAELQGRLGRYAAELERSGHERERLTRDLHDGLGGIITNMALLGELALRKAEAPEVRNVLGKLTELARESLSEIRGFMGSLDDRELTWHSVAADLRQHGVNMLDPHGIVLAFHSHVASDVPAPGRQVYLNLLRIYKEALANVARHAQAATVTVELRVLRGRILLAVSDDGRGLNGRGQGRGLDNMHARAHELGGTLEVDDRAGVQVRLGAPFP